jgi:hypothetical protein
MSHECQLAPLQGTYLGHDGDRAQALAAVGLTA